MEINFISTICKYTGERTRRERSSMVVDCRCVETERQYDGSRFNHHVCSDFSFEDHSPPTIKMILAFCQHAEAQLKDMADRTLVIHCKAGKVSC